MITQPGATVAFDHPSKAVIDLGRDEDASKQATTMILQAQGSTDDAGNQNPLTARADNDDLLDDGYPAMWRINSSDHSNVSVQATLDGYATSYAAAYHDPVVKYPFTVRADNPTHPLGSYRAGAKVQLTVHRDPWISPGTYTQRVTDIAPSGLKVTLTVSEAP